MHLESVPSRAPLRLERLAAACLQADADDSRLGDLSERYVSIHERARRHLGTTPWARLASHLAADLHYLTGTANVTLFARVVDPVLRVTENAALPLVAVDLRERTMTVLRVTAGKLVLPGFLLVGSVLLVNSAVDAWSTLRQPDLSELPQIAAALAGTASGKPVDGRAFDANRSGASVVSVHATVPTTGWRVFVELPFDEARAPLWSALIRVAGMLGLGLVAALLASVIAAPRVRPVHAAPA